MRFNIIITVYLFPFNALTLLVGRQESHPTWKKTGCWFVRLDALAKALSVIATATWLGGWLAGWLGVRHTPVLYHNG